MYHANGSEAPEVLPPQRGDEATQQHHRGPCQRQIAQPRHGHQDICLPEHIDIQRLLFRPQPIRAAAAIAIVPPSSSSDLTSAHPQQQQAGLATGLSGFQPIYLLRASQGWFCNGIKPEGMGATNQHGFLWSKPEGINGGDQSAWSFGSLEVWEKFAM